MVETMDMCVHCGQGAAEHHGFEPVVTPKGCVCDPKWWRDPVHIPGICATFVGPPDDWCETCQHGPECHVAAPAPEETGEPR